MSRIHNSGEQNIGDIYLRNVAHNANLFLGLYTNATQPLEADTIAQITEIIGGGYARIAMTPANWVMQGTQTPEGGTRYDQPMQAFVFNAAVANATGYFIATTATGGILIASEHFATPIVINQAGFRVEITPRIEFR